MSDEALSEFAMPVISLTPMVSLASKPIAPALLSPKLPDADIPAPPAPVISFSNCVRVGEENGHTLFDITFVVDCGAGEPAPQTVVRRLAVCNASFAAEAGKTPTFYIESDKKEVDSKLAKRMRELSGIPHRGNFI